MTGSAFERVARSRVRCGVLIARELDAPEKQELVPLFFALLSASEARVRVLLLPAGIPFPE